MEKKLKKLAWYKNYLEIKTELEAGLILDSRYRGWLNYQRKKIVPLPLKKQKLLDELKPFMKNDWRKDYYKAKIEIKPRKRKSISGLGDRIKQARIKRGYDSPYALSKETKIAISTIKDWENEKSIPTSDKLITLCIKLSVSADYLLFGKKRN